MKILRGILTGLVLALSIPPQMIAQEQVHAEADPIAEMLDSLVMLNHVVRYSNLTNGQYGENPGPSKAPLAYSDEIYSQRISKIVSPIPLEFNNQVKQYVDLYAFRKRELTTRVMGLSMYYFPLFEEILDREGLPLELKYLSIVESALNPLAVSRVGATGLWQFMYNTGKLYDMKITSYYDERRDPIKSTYAACRYFKDMYAIYQDWLLVIASYNCGPGNVNKAIKRSGGKTNFWEISRYLPAETRGYVPAFVAVCYLMNYSTEHNLFPVTPAFNYFEVDTVSVEAGISLSKIAEAIDLPLDVLSYLNPVYKRGVIPNTEKHNYLRLPSGKVYAYIDASEKLFAPEDPVAIPATVPSAQAGNETGDGAFTYEYKKVRKYYVIHSGDNLSRIAQKYNCTVADLKKWNKMSSSTIFKGKKLAVYTLQKIKVPVPQPENIAKVDKVEPSQEAVSTIRDEKSSGKFIYHLVVKGDTLWNIAKRYEGVTVEQIVEINRLTDVNNLKPGTRLKVLING